jgi:hypothetical protein
MSSLWATIEEQLQLCLRFLDPIVELLKNTRISHISNLLIEIEHVKEERSSLNFSLQKIGLKGKVQKVDEVPTTKF